MPILYRTTSIFDSPAETLVCPVNCRGVMGAGLALEFRERYPSLFEDFKTSKLRIGHIWLWQHSGGYVCCFPTKDDWRKRSEVWMIEEGLLTFSREVVPSGAVDRVAFPKLGCGLGGLRWHGVVQPLMERYLADLPIKVYVHV